jgi:hypothetical protein
MKKIISFSLWGDDDKYCLGAYRNALLAPEVYPGWECWFYVREGDTNFSVLKLLADMDHVNLIFTEKPSSWTGMFDRFEAILDPDVEAFISRDCDSRLSAREAAAVEEWLESDKGFHIMRDHPYHGTEILGGMWGMKKDCVPFFGELMSAWNQEDRWQTDQDFLKAAVYPRVVNDSMVHDEFFSLESHRRSFPTAREGCNFVGQIFEGDGSTPQEHIQPLADYLNRKK